LARKLSALRSSHPSGGSGSPEKKRRMEVREGKKEEKKEEEDGGHGHLRPLPTLVRRAEERPEWEEIRRVAREVEELASIKLKQLRQMELFDL
ncbi:hypothetical protein KEM55_006779, partial [Ascosphaera atra]